jgi:hypothetical protein
MTKKRKINAKIFCLKKETFSIRTTNIYSNYGIFGMQIYHLATLPSYVSLRIGKSNNLGNRSSRDHTRTGG